MNTKKIIFLISGLVIMLGLATAGILAWLTAEDTTPTKTFVVGEVKYTWDEGTFNQNPVVPGQNVVTKSFQLLNESNVNSELRFSISITYGEDNLDGSSYVDLTFGPNWVFDSGYYYYRSGSAVDGKYPITPATTTIPVLTGLVLKGNLVGNSFANTEFTISITFQAKQNDFVTWEELGSVNFTTGI